MLAAERRESGGRVCGVLADIWFKPQRRYVRLLWLIPFRAAWLPWWVGWELREHARQIITKTNATNPGISPDPEAMWIARVGVHDRE